jgi:Zn-finger nucleic acid-binding protein
LQYMNKIDQCGSVWLDAAVPEKQKINLFLPKRLNFSHTDRYTDVHIKNEMIIKQSSSI